MSIKKQNKQATQGALARAEQPHKVMQYRQRATCILGPSLNLAISVVHATSFVKGPYEPWKDLVGYF